MIAIILGLLAVAGVVYLVLAHLATLRHFAATPATPPADWPSVSILKPVRGADEHSREALATFCRQDYHGDFEVLVGTMNPDDPIVVVVEQLQAELPEAPLRMVITRPLGANRKTAKMHSLAGETRGELLFFSDADVEVTPDYLTRLVPELLAAGVGCVTCLPRPIDARTVGGRLVALHYAQVYLPQWMMAARTTGIRFAIGMTMAVRRADLDAIGGFGPFADALADDYELGNRIARLGRQVVVPAFLLDTLMPREGVGAAYARLLRWKRTIRRCRPRDYAGMAFCHPLIWSLFLTAALPAAWPVPLLVLALRWLLAAHLNARLVRMPDWPRAWWLLPLLDLIEWLTFFGAYLGNTIVWGGRRYRLRPNGDLEPLTPAGRRDEA